MTKKRCTDCKHTRGIGYDFWCDEGHTEYELFMGETNCPYFEYHDWSKGTPSEVEERFKCYKQPKQQIQDRINQLENDLEESINRINDNPMSETYRKEYRDEIRTLKWVLELLE